MSQIPPIKIPKLMNHPDLLIWTTITLLQVTMTIIMISKPKWIRYNNTTSTGGISIVTYTNIQQLVSETYDIR